MLAGCETKDDTTTHTPLQSSTKKPTNVPTIASIIKVPKTIKASLNDDTYVITNISNNTMEVNIESDQVQIKDLDKSIILINIFNMGSSQSRGMIPYLNDLQKEYKDRIFVLGLPQDNDISKERIKEFMIKHDARYYISNSFDNTSLANNIAQYIKLGTNYPIPLTVIFKDGKYVTHYLGATPIEMIRSDIDQFIN